MSTEMALTWPAATATALAAAPLLLLFAAIPAQGSDSREAVSWEADPCLRFSGVISITRDGLEDTVPQDAQVCTFCDSDPAVTLHWHDKFLILFFEVERSSDTFNLVELQYYEGEKSWSVEVAGFRGQVGGEVRCSHQTRLALTYKGTPAPSNHGCKIDARSRRNHPLVRAAEDETTATATGDETMATSGDETAAPSGDETMATSGDETVATSGDDTTATTGDETTTTTGDETTATSGDKTTASSGDKTASDERVIGLTKFTIKYSKNLKEESLYVSGCRVAPDLTTVLAASGAATAAILAAAAAVALRLGA